MQVESREYPEHQWSIPRIQVWEDLVNKAREFDTMTAQPNCEDPAKAEFEKEIQKTKERLLKLEKLQALKTEVAALEKELGLNHSPTVTSTSRAVYSPPY